MTPEEVRTLVREMLPQEMYERRGAVLYTGTDALMPGRAYLMGFNPGGPPGENMKPLIETIPERKNCSEYTQCWLCPQDVTSCEHLGPDGRVLPAARGKHQRYVLRIIEALNVKPERLLAANAIFGRSKGVATLLDESGFDRDTWWRYCWPVHQRFLRIVRPKVVVSFGYGAGTSPLDLLKRMCPEVKVRSVGGPGRRGGWEFRASLDLSDGDVLETQVIGVPHPSWYEISPLLAERLREAAR